MCDHKMSSFLTFFTFLPIIQLHFKLFYLFSVCVCARVHNYAGTSMKVRGPFTGVCSQATMAVLGIELHSIWSSLLASAISNQLSQWSFLHFSVKY